jgi:hypothetical protein
MRPPIARRLAMLATIGASSLPNSPFIENVNNFKSFLVFKYESTKKYGKSLKTHLLCLNYTTSKFDKF